MHRPQLAPGAVYAIADAGLLGLGLVPRAVEAIAEAGVETIQLRLKSGDSDAEKYRITEACVRILEGSGVSLWMDDRADLATLFELPGLHLGQRDLPASAARKVVGKGSLLGMSTHNESELRAAALDDDVDVVAIGPVFATSTKNNPDPLVGLEGVQLARRISSKPLVAIGGIDEPSVVKVLEAGADSVAVAGAICRGPGEMGSIKVNCRRLLAAAAAAGRSQGMGNR